MSEKIRSQHLARKAMLYVRQSSAFKVTHNQESSKLQYAMQARLRELGFTEIEIVDEDLGRSAAGTVTRSGFERMVAEVSLGRVGAVAAREVSRFARNSREWQQLVEVCRIVDTVLIDQEAVYAPRASNDRLLLGLKGSLLGCIRECHHHSHPLSREKQTPTVSTTADHFDASSAVYFHSPSQLPPASFSADFSAVAHDRGLLSSSRTAWFDVCLCQPTSRGLPSSFSVVQKNRSFGSSFHVAPCFMIATAFSPNTSMSR
jgi:hypothetical protein